MGHPSFDNLRIMGHPSFLGIKWELWEVGIMGHPSFDNLS